MAGEAQVHAADFLVDCVENYLLDTPCDEQLPQDDDARDVAPPFDHQIIATRCHSTGMAHFRLAEYVKAAQCFTEARSTRP